MFWFILCVLAAIATLVLVFRDRGRVGGEDTPRVDLRRLAAVPGGLAVVFLLLSVVRVVPPGTVAIPVTFDKSGELGFTCGMMMKVGKIVVQ